MLRAKTMRIAIVDNNADFVRSIKLLLGLRGYEVTAFTCPIAALSEMAQAAPDVLIVDLSMPVLSGIQLVHELVQQDCSPDATVLISAHTDLVEGMDLGQAGIDVFLPKPFDLDALVFTLEALRPAESSL